MLISLGNVALREIRVLVSRVEKMFDDKGPLVSLENRQLEYFRRPRSSHSSVSQANRHRSKQCWLMNKD